MVGKILLGLAALTLAGCTNEAAYQHRGAAFGQTIEVNVSGLQPEVAKLAVTQAMEDLDFVEQGTDPWQPGPMGRTNLLLSTTSPFSANPSLLPLIKRARELSARTHGYYNPALGGVHELWRATPTGPSPAALERLLNTRPAMAQIEIDGIQLRAANPEVRLHFGPMALGHALDLASDSLRAAGAHSSTLRLEQALVTSGEASASFVVPDGDGGRTHIRLGGDEALVSLHTSAAGTQARDMMFDPFRGRPVAPGRLAVVVTPSAAEAAAVAMALLVAGPERFEAVARELEVTDALLIANGRQQVSLGMARRLSSVAAVD